jgi:hypothetical protein
MLPCFYDERDDASKNNHNFNRANRNILMTNDFYQGKNRVSNSVKNKDFIGDYGEKRFFKTQT